MNHELMDKPNIEVTPRRLTVTLTESQARQLVERLKFKQTHLPDLTEPVWQTIENCLGYTVEETPSL